MKNLQFDKKLFFILKTVGNCLKTVVIVIFSLKMLIFIDFPINSLKINIFYVNYMLLRSIAQHYFQKILNLPDLFELSLIIETKNPPQTLSCVHTTFKQIQNIENHKIYVFSISLLKQIPHTINQNKDGD